MITTRYVQMVFVAAAWTLLPLLSGCGPSGDGTASFPEARQALPAGPDSAEYDVGMSPSGEHRVEVFFGALSGQLTVLLNGFPVYQSNGGQMGRTVDSETERPINTALVGEDNELVVRLVPMLRRQGRRLQVAEQHLAWQVRERWGEALVQVPASEIDSAYAAWQRSLDPVWTAVLQAEASGRLSDASAIEAMRDSVAARPFELTATFDNERGPDFSYLFEEAPVITDTTRLVDYALQLRDWFHTENESALLNAFHVSDDGSPKTEDEREAADRRFRQDLQNIWFDSTLKLEFTREDVRVEKWVNGRIWRIYRAPNQPLIEAESGIHMSSIYVADVSGQLKVVR